MTGKGFPHPICFVPAEAPSEAVALERVFGTPCPRFTPDG